MLDPRKMVIGGEVTWDDGTTLIQTVDGIKQFDLQEREELNAERRNVAQWLQDNNAV